MLHALFLPVGLPLVVGAHGSGSGEFFRGLYVLTGSGYFHSGLQDVLVAAFDHSTAQGEFLLDGLISRRGNRADCRDIARRASR